MSKILVIGESNTGLGAMVLFVINILHTIESFKLDIIPIAIFGKKCLYYSKQGHNNKQYVWEYYFKPLIENYDEKYYLQNSNNIICPLGTFGRSSRSYSASGLIGIPGLRYPTIQGKRLKDAQKIPCLFGGGKRRHNGRIKKHPIKSADSWSTHKKQYSVMPKYHRRMGHEIIKKYIKVNDDIKEKVENFFNQIGSNYIIGCHVRGTDAEGNGRRKKENIGTFFCEIDKLLKKNSNAVIFLATDEIKYIDQFKQKYKTKLYYTNCIRHKKGDRVAIEYPRGVVMPAFISKNPQQNGEECIIDWLLLSKCNILVSNLSSVSTLVLLKNPEIPQIYIRNAYSPVYS